MNRWCDKNTNGKRSAQDSCKICKVTLFLVAYLHIDAVHGPSIIHSLNVVENNIVRLEDVGDD